MRLLKIDSIDDDFLTKHKLIQQDLIRPHVYSSLKQYLLNKYRWLDEVLFNIDTLEDGRKTVSFYARWSDYSPNEVDSEGRLISKA